MLLYCIILFKKFSNQLSVFLALDLELISLLFDFHYLFPFCIEHLLHLLHSPFEFCLFFLSFLEFPLNSVDKLLLRPDLLQFFIPLHAISLKSFDSLAVVSQNLGHMDACVNIF